MPLLAPFVALALLACSDGTAPEGRVDAAMRQLNVAFNSGTLRGEWAWYAIAALQHGAELTELTVDVDGQQRGFEGVAFGYILDDQESGTGTIYRDSLVVLVAWRGEGAREMIATAHLTDNLPTSPATLDLRGMLERRARALPVSPRRSLEAQTEPVTRSIGTMAAGDLPEHYLWYMLDGSVWIDSIVHSGQANLTYGSQSCATRTLVTPQDFSFDVTGLICRRGTFRQALDVRLWPELDGEGRPMAQGRFDLVMRVAEYQLPNFLDFLQ